MCIRDRYKGNYSYYLEKREERIEAKTVEIERANNLYRTELEWMRRIDVYKRQATYRVYNLSRYYLEL